ncbi:MAG TPA: DUF1566 domain-containing protein, partial [bacterium]|nr:DUF1566 domain-containing protein [bacterium]
MRKMLVCFLASLVLWSVSCDNGTQRVPTDETALNDVDTPLADELVADDYTDAPITETGSDADEVAVVLPYPIVDTGQTHCYDDHTGIICPSTGAAYFGQDAQYIGNPPSYTVSNDGLTVLDNVTGLTWQRSPDTNGDGIIDASDKLTHEEALAWPATVNAASYGGFNDWRLPTIKEQYSLINFNGQDPSGLMSNDTSSITPFIDDTVFGFAYGDTAAGERIIDSQYASSNLYVDTTTVGDLLFGVNFADGRIKGYGLTMPNGDKKFFFVTLVRGNPDYGINDFEDNDDGTITDHATGLMWMKDDSGEGMNWAAALAYAQTKNAESYLGYNDWRLPHVK